MVDRIQTYMSPEQQGYLPKIANAFEIGGQETFRKEKELRDQLINGAATDPTVLARYQAYASEMSLVRNAQSSTVKLFKDTSLSILQNMR